MARLFKAEVVGGGVVAFVICVVGMGCWFKSVSGGSQHDPPKQVSKTEETPVSITYTRVPKGWTSTSRSFRQAKLHWRYGDANWQSVLMKLGDDTDLSCTYNAAIPPATGGAVSVEYYFTVVFDGYPNSHPREAPAKSIILPVGD